MPKKVSQKKTLRKFLNAEETFTRILRNGKLMKCEPLKEIFSTTNFKYP